jgi:hypothetical protein
VIIGDHGERMLQLLRPGFHSGTLPRLFARLRYAERTAYKTGSWRSARSYRQALGEVETALRHFVEREFLALVHQSPAWSERPLSVGTIALANNRIGIHLVHATFPQIPFWLAIELHRGWLDAHIEEEGWLRQLNEYQLRSLSTALAGLYKLAGIDLVREQIEAQLAPARATYAITARGLVIQPVAGKDDGIVYSLNGEPDPEAAERVKALDPRLLIFARTPIPWQEWVALWRPRPEQDGPAPFGFVLGYSCETQLNGPPAAAEVSMQAPGGTREANSLPVVAPPLGRKPNGEEGRRNGSN